MNSVLFLLAAIGFVCVSVFVFMNYPLAWRKDRLFVTVLVLWHLLGTSCLVWVFVFFFLYRCLGFFVFFRPFFWA